MITYECTTCGNATQLTNTRSKAAERLVKACEDCGDVSCHQMAQDIPDELDDEARDMLRAVNPTVLIRRSSKGDKCYHIKHGNDPLCGTHADLREVSIKTFPPGYHAWCGHCLTVAREGIGHCSGGTGSASVDKEDCIEAIQQADEETDRYLSRELYRDVADSPSVHQVVSTFDGWREAREAALGWSL